MRRPSDIAWRRSLKPGSHQRRAGVGDQRHRLALGDPAQQDRPHALGIMLVVGQKRRIDAVAL
jgi:hypothetical protein